MIVGMKRCSGTSCHFPFSTHWMKIKMADDDKVMWIAETENCNYSMTARLKPAPSIISRYCLRHLSFTLSAIAARTSKSQKTKTRYGKLTIWTLEHDIGMSCSYYLPFFLSSLFSAIVRRIFRHCHVLSASGVASNYPQFNSRAHTHTLIQAQLPFTSTNFWVLTMQTRTME